MKTKILSVCASFSMLLGGLGATSTFAEGVEDVPSQSYVDELYPKTADNQVQSAGKEYARAFTCDAGTDWTEEPWTESGGYNWIVDKGNKGYVQEAERGGTTLGVVLDDVIIDFSYSYLVKLSYDGNNKSHVRGIQSTLKCLGYNPGTIDGIYGKTTEAAVKAFQKKRGLTEDGVVGKQTYHYLSFAAY
ncbi:peptidoglycan-binding domain-containing protein [Bacillus sp. CGMCC 1.16541]|uniref:peptidoglycan-binding domain-containing protein n=1 Tax=Bacillus sp. CGMCC 1.16541 TaxID=2185143 RepID=UPI00194FB00B|nr:peptidoglycan-binding domain-containing protein [Bacillus sp. CGMCC 1.16541]